MEKVEKTERSGGPSCRPRSTTCSARRAPSAAFTGAYWDTKDGGVYRCKACGEPLFDSETKFDSGTGWPSFYAPMDVEAVETEDDRSFFMRRTEVDCNRCGGHLGHVFEDGPNPTGLRYCINSCSLDFEAEGRDQPIDAGAPASTSAGGSGDVPSASLAVLEQGDQRPADGGRGAVERVQDLGRGVGAAAGSARRAGAPGSRWCSSTR